LVTESNKNNNTFALPYAPPQITNQPINRIVIQGSNAVFSVAASGAAPLDYQWAFKGADLEDGDRISGSTSNVLTISEVETNDAGSYVVTISNEEGTSHGASVTLTVVGLQGLVPASEYAALVDLFNSTGGTDWKDNRGWLDPGAADWNGVEVTNLQFAANGNFLLNSGNVSGLDLETNGLAGNLPSSLGDLTALQSLSLAGNQLQGPIPPIFSSLTLLQTLDLSSNKLTGSIPAGLGDLSLSLTSIDFSANELSNSLPSDLQGMSALETLDLSQNSLSGTVNLGVMSQLITLNLNGNGFTGSLTNLVLAPNLQTNDLGGNHFTNTIPINSGFFLSLNQDSLRYLDLSGNALNGALPDFGAFTQLQFLDLSDNQLTGPILTDLNNLTLLQTLDLSGNHLTGPIPALDNLSQLEKLSLHDNDLTGAMPTSLTQLAQLESLNLSSNHLTGPILDLSSLANLKSVALDRNDLNFTTNSPPLGPPNFSAVVNMLFRGLTVSYLPQNPPSITANPRNESVVAGGAAQLSATVDGAPPFGFQWQFNGASLAARSRISGAQTTNLSISPVQSADLGLYQIMVTNAYGAVTSAPAMLTVTTVAVPPQITSLPTNQTVNLGQSAAFSVTATGSAPLFYQWNLNGTNLPGATGPVVLIPNAAFTNSGSYHVVVSNAAGAKTNLAGDLSVATVPLLLGGNGAGLQYLHGLVVLQISGLTGAGTAALQASSNLLQWTTLSTVPGAAGLIQMFDTAPANQRYYRVVVAP
jgi:Leucine-rich repeat (LRR) protein